MSEPNGSVAAYLHGAKRIVVKLGSSLLTNEGRGLDEAAIAGWADQIAKLTLSGREVVLVSSGAIAEGMQRLGWKRRPRAIHDLQAAAAVGGLRNCGSGLSAICSLLSCA